MKGWHFLVLMGIWTTNLEGAVKRDRSKKNSGEEGVSTRCKHDLGSTVESKKLATRLFSAFCEARESSHVHLESLSRCTWSSKQQTTLS